MRNTLSISVTDTRIFPVRSPHKSYHSCLFKCCICSNPSVFWPYSDLISEIIIKTTAFCLCSVHTRSRPCLQRLTSCTLSILYSAVILHISYLPHTSLTLVLLSLQLLILVVGQIGEQLFTSMIET